MSLLKKNWRRRKPTFRSIFHQEDFLRESDSSIEKAVFWTSNFLSIPSSGKSLLNLKNSQEQCLKEKLNKIKIVINVGGERFVMAYKTISLYPHTLLATQEIDKYFDRKRKEYFFDRDPDMFRYVFKFYTHDKIHFPMDECIQALIDEFKFFRIPLDIMKDCCYAEFHLEYENNTNSTKFAKQNRPARQSTTSRNSHNVSSKSLSDTNWFRYLLSRSESRAVTNILLFCIVFNILGMILETLPCSSNSEKCGDLYAKTFFIFDTICVLILTLEFAVSFSKAQNKKAYFCRVPIATYFASLVPAYIMWLLYSILGFRNTPIVLEDICNALRVIRIVKIANSSSHLRDTVGQIMSAARGLGLILLTCIIAIIVLSVLLYHLDDTCPHVPLGMWYFVVTMTSLGYGDYVPSATSGKLLGAVAVILGILVVSLPVPIIQNKIGASLDVDPEPETDEIVLDSLYPPDFKYRQRRMSRMFSLEHRVNTLKKSVENVNHVMP
ncbi:potassium voltage-gated channel subfamily D member 3-like [Dendronephthya gigantea]|uniref:potassium voltage-gated channel subfamily D member 3-like n=1 Tax=Dendronephthya gigantea TaxID=151771 RepID=UPI00106B7A59|nr:potassium voltage-gated channel subfamily D member 3-like [Dendronephthya gigantea]